MLRQVETMADCALTYSSEVYVLRTYRDSEAVARSPATHAILTVWKAPFGNKTVRL